MLNTKYESRHIYRQTHNQSPNKIYRAVLSEVKRYFVDTAAALSFYMPLLTGMEFLSGMEPNEVYTSRSTAGLFYLAVGRGGGKFRELWARKVMKTGPQSSKSEKIITEVTYTWILQVPIYLGVLIHSGASWRETFVALPAGMLLTLFSSRPYGIYLDKYRRLSGEKPVLEK